MKKIIILLSILSSLASYGFAGETKTCSVGMPCTVASDQTVTINSPSTQAGTWYIEYGQGQCQILSQQGQLQFSSWNYNQISGLSKNQNLSPGQVSNWAGKMLSSAANNGVFNHFALKFTNISPKPMTFICDGKFQSHWW